MQMVHFWIGIERSLLIDHIAMNLEKTDPLYHCLIRFYEMIAVLIFYSHLFATKLRSFTIK